MTQGARPESAASTRAGRGTRGSASVNGLQLYYETHGTGSPLVLLHGGIGGLMMFDEIAPLLAKDRQVIAVDLQAHGGTADVDRPMRFESMADDIAGLIKHLGLGQADILGYSLGGGVALQTAIRHPDVVGKLVLISTPFKRNGWYPEVLAGMAQVGSALAEMMKQSPFYQYYASVAPRPEDWPVLLDKISELLKRDYDWSADVAAIQAPTLIVVGDADGVRTSHAVEMFELLGGGQRDAGLDGSGMPRSHLAILPAQGHYDILPNPLLVSILTSFLEAPAESAKRAA